MFSLHVLCETTQHHHIDVFCICTSVTNDNFQDQGTGNARATSGLERIQWKSNLYFTPALTTGKSYTKKQLAPTQILSPANTGNPILLQA